MSRVVHFEIHAENPERRHPVLTTTVCSTGNLRRWQGPMEYWVDQDRSRPAKPGIDGGLVRRHGTIDGTAVIAFVCTVDVPNLDEKLTQLGTTRRHGTAENAHSGRRAGSGYAKDTEGNIFGMMQSDTQVR